MRITIAILALFIGANTGLWAQAEINLMPRIQGNDITYYGVVGEFSNMVGFQFSIKWDPEKMAYRKMTYREDMKFAMFNDKKADRGMILTSWFADKVGGLSLQKCDTVFTIKFEKIKAFGEVEISSDPLKIEMINAATQRLPFRSKVISDCGVTSTEDKKNDFDFRLYPNLVRTSGDMRLLTRFKDPLTVHVYDLGGQLVLERDMELERQFTAPSAAGVYIIKVIHDDKVIHSEKFIVQ